jgi:hypothetical protein
LGKANQGQLPTHLLWLLSKSLAAAMTLCEQQRRQNKSAVGEKERKSRQLRVYTHQTHDTHT